MKLKIFIAILCLGAIVLSGCSFLSSDDSGEDGSDDSKYLSAVTSLEEKLEKLSAEYHASEKEREEKIEELKEQLTSILEGEEDKNDQSEEQDPTSTVLPDKFSYTVGEKGALITGYSGKTETLVIPSYIDGVKVYGIAESAFAFSDIKSVIVSEGVEYIDWFAFFNSPFLISVTIPSSVSKIEYSAFDGASSSLVIYCHKDSYAHSYAQSYGIAYVLI